MKITYQPFGDQALLLQWEQRIDPIINAQVSHLSRAIETAGIPGIQYCLPAYCSLTVGYQPEQISYEKLCASIASIIPDLEKLSILSSENRKIIVPVCYDDIYAPDLEWLATHTSITREQIIQLHTSTSFRVYMLGFMPGFPYLGTLPKSLEAPRKETPRLSVPAGSVALAGLQTGIYPIESPGGWQIIGRTPWKIFDPEREEPFLLQVGDEVRFEAIDQVDFDKMIKQ